VLLNVFIIRQFKVQRFINITVIISYFRGLHSIYLCKKTHPHIICGSVAKYFVPTEDYNNFANIEICCKKKIHEEN